MRRGREGGEWGFASRGRLDAGHWRHDTMDGVAGDSVLVYTLISDMWGVRARVDWGTVWSERRIYGLLG